MQDLNVVTVQANQVWEDKEANFANYERLLQQVKNVDLIVLPEMFQTGFSMNSSHLAESIDGGSVNWLKNIAASKNSAIYTSLIIEENGQFYNRGLLVQANGTVSEYNKRHLFALAGEDEYYSAGEKKMIVELNGWKINLQVCYDLRFPENARNKLINEKPEYDLLVYVANWPERRIHHWSSLLMARAIENQCFVIGVNRVGVDANNLNYNGKSAVITALGEIISNHTENEESIQHTTLKVSELTETRERLPFLKDAIF